MPTLLQRLRTIADDDIAKRDRWKDALKWVNDRASDHEVHAYIQVDGTMQVQTKLLFADFHPSNSHTYDDSTVSAMLDWFVFAKIQYSMYL